MNSYRPLASPDRWSIWSRPASPPGDWVREVALSAERCAELLPILARNNPELDCVILPPGEVPEMGRRECHRRVAR